MFLLRSRMVTGEILEQLDGIGPDFERQLVELASIHGTSVEPIPEQPVRFATDRIALSEHDRKARNEFIRPKMAEAGMEVLSNNPLGEIGVFRGKDPDIAPLVILSHADTVPYGDMYDGTTGVLAGIEIVKSMKETGYQPDRDIMVISLTGEESAGFNVALFGSKSMFQGLTDADLDSRKDSSSPPIREFLTDEETRNVKRPIFSEGKKAKFKLPHAVIELHVEQDTKLSETGRDLGLVTAIAAANRYNVNFGEEPLEAQKDEYGHYQHFKLTVSGKADHSGATPMDRERRADGLVETATIMLPFMSSIITESGISANIAKIAVEGQAMNKIPGHVETAFRLGGDSKEEIDYLKEELRNIIIARNQFTAQHKPHFDKSPVWLTKIADPENYTYFDEPESLKRHLGALMLARQVELTAASFSPSGVVGTATRYQANDHGIVTVGLDIRGVEKESRNQAIDDIFGSSTAIEIFSRPIFSEPLAGSGDPASMSPELLTALEEEIEEYRIGSYMRMESSAGHDIQNAARAGLPSAMIFIPSLRGGVAHHPDAYTAPESLEKGTKALAALAARLSYR